jgi:alcohol dehydrogenase class IV
MPFEFATAVRIVYGSGTASQLPGLVRELGRRPLLVTGRARGATAASLERLVEADLVAAHLTVSSEPTLDVVRAAVAAAEDASCDAVVAIGGGSAIDTGKAVAALLANGGDPLDYLEVIGKGRALSVPALPVVAVPTTAGSGAEVTRNAVLASPGHRVKVSLRHASMLPRVALVDPALTLDLPPALTAATGLDALAQLVEPYVSRRANALTDALCREGMVQVSGWLRAAFEDGNDLAAREAMSLASLLGGLALANAGLGAVHGFAGPLGGRLEAPHGALCAALLPAAFGGNLAALRARDHDRSRLSRFDHVARLLTGDREAAAEDGIAWLEALRADLGVAGLSAYGYSPAMAPDLIAAARASSSMKGNPIDLTDEELLGILRAAG